MMAKSSIWGPATASGGAVICAVALAGFWFAQARRPGPPEIPRAAESAAAPSTPQSSAAPRRADSEGAGAPSVASPGPRIDVARVTPKGDVVIAGRAEPGAKVALLDGGATLLETQANPATGEFVLLPARLAAGAHKLSLRSTTSSNGVQTREVDVMAFSVSPPTVAAEAASSGDVRRGPARRARAGRDGASRVGRGRQTSARRGSREATRSGASAVRGLGAGLSIRRSSRPIRRKSAIRI